MKALAMVLILAMLMVMAPATLAETATDYTEPVKVTANMFYTDICEDDLRTKWVEDKFNIDIEFVICSLNDVREKARLWISSGDMPDIMWTEFGLANTELQEFAESGMLTPWPDFKDYPNLAAIQADISDPVEKLIAMTGDRYYYLCDGGWSATNQVQPVGFYYRTDWSKQLGLFHENHTYTWDEVMAMAIAFGTGDPDGDGQINTIGMTSTSTWYPMLYGLWQTNPYWSEFTKVDGKYVWGPTMPETLDGLRYVKNLYDSGALWEEQVMAKYNDGVNKFSAGLAGICGDNWHMPGTTVALMGMQDTMPDADLLDVVSPMNIINPDGTFTVQRSGGWWGQVSLSAAMSEAELSRVMDMFDYLASEEGFLLSAIGIKDQDYTLSDTGDITLNWEKDAEGSYISPYQSEAHRFISIPRLFEGYALYSPATAETIKILGNRHNDWLQNEDGRVFKQTDVDLSALVTPLYKSLVLEPGVSDKVKELIITTENAEALIEAYNAWVESVMPQILPVLDEINDALT